MRGILELIPGLVATSLMPCAVPAQEPMSFRVADELGQSASGAIIAIGEISGDTPAAFRDFLANQEAPVGAVYFSSVGGSLFSAIELGKEIREAGLVTVVDPRHPATENAVCASACVYAFMGGLRRIAPVNNTLGVHQFYNTSEIVPDDALSVGQSIISILLAYSDEMGIASRFVEIASAVSPDELYWFNAVEARAINLSTDDTVMRPVEWRYVRSALGDQDMHRVESEFIYNGRRGLITATCGTSRGGYSPRWGMSIRIPFDAGVSAHAVSSLQRPRVKMTGEGRYQEDFGSYMPWRTMGSNNTGLVSVGVFDPDAPAKDALRFLRREYAVDVEIDLQRFDASEARLDLDRVEYETYSVRFHFDNVGLTRALASLQEEAPRCIEWLNRVVR